MDSNITSQAWEITTLQNLENATLQDLENATSQDLENTTLQVLQNTTDSIIGFNDYPDYFTFGDPKIYLPVFYGLHCLSGGFGTVTNIFVLITISMTNLSKKLSLLFLMHQAVCDLVTSVGLMISAVGMWSQGTGYLFCKLVWSEIFTYIGLVASGYNTVCLAAERYLMVEFPHRYRVYFTKNTAVKAMVAIWLFAIVINIPLILPVDSEQHQCFVGYLFNSKKASKAYSVACIILTFFIPVALIVGAYSRMLYILHNKNKRQIEPVPGPSSIQPVNRSSRIAEAQKNIFDTLIIVTGVFLLTWSPLQIYTILPAAGMPLIFDDPLYYLFLLLNQVNAGINPFIYLYCFKGFNADAMALLKCQRGKKVSPVPVVLPLAARDKHGNISLLKTRMVDPNPVLPMASRKHVNKSALRRNRVEPTFAIPLTGRKHVNKSSLNKNRVDPSPILPIADGKHMSKSSLERNKEDPSPGPSQAKMTVVQQIFVNPKEQPTSVHEATV